MLLIFIVGQKYLVEGIAFSGLKGKTYGIFRQGIEDFIWGDYNPEQWTPDMGTGYGTPDAGRNRCGDAECL